MTAFKPRWRNPAALLTLVSGALLGIALLLTPWINPTPAVDLASLAAARGIQLPAGFSLSQLPAGIQDQLNQAVASGNFPGLAAAVGLQTPPEWAVGLLIVAVGVALLAAIFALVRPTQARNLRLLAVLAGLVAVAYFALFLRVQTDLTLNRLTGGVTFGFWLALAGTAGLFLQGLLPVLTDRKVDAEPVGYIDVDLAALTGRTGVVLPSVNLRQNLAVAFDALLTNKLRAALTMLGIVIGVGSVVALMSIGQGAQDTVTASIEGIGTNILTVSPVGQSSMVNTADADAIAAQVSGVKVVPRFNANLTVIAGDNSLTTQVAGVTPLHFEVRNLETELGRPFDDNDEGASARVAVLGTTSVEDLFGAGVNPVGESIRIGNQRFEVIGVLEQQDATIGQDPNAAILIPLSTGYRYLFNARPITGNDDRVSSITVWVADRDRVDVVMDQLDVVLRELHELNADDEADFRVFNQQQLLDTISSVTGTFTIMLAAIAGVSLVVGGIGVMNITLVSVTERTREIGLRKAIGAKKHHIMQQFLIETIVLSTLGGIVGVLVGISIALLVNATGALTASITVQAIALGLSASVITGVFFGVYPASRAAALQPIEALRYE